MTKSIKRPIFVGAITAIFLAFTFSSSAFAGSYDVVTSTGYDITNVGFTPDGVPGTCKGFSFYLTNPAPASGKTFALYSFPDSVTDISLLGNYFLLAINTANIDSPIYTCFDNTNILIAEVDSSGTGNAQVVCFDLGSCSHTDVATIGIRLATVNIIPPVIPSVVSINCSKFIYTNHTSESVCNTAYVSGYVLATNPHPDLQLSQSCIQSVNDYGTYKSVGSEVCSTPFVKPPDPANDNCGFDILAPTSWVSCLFIPTDSNFSDLKLKYDNFLKGSAIGQVTGLFTNLVFSTSEILARGSNDAQSKTCLGPHINFMYVPLTGLAHGYIQ